MTSIFLVFHEKKWGGIQGIEPWTSKTQTLNHTTRPDPRVKRRGIVGPFIFLEFSAQSLWVRWYMQQFKPTHAAANKKNKKN